jgi:hypothetical protein
MGGGKGCYAVDVVKQSPRRRFETRATKADPVVKAKRSGNIGALFSGSGVDFGMGWDRRMRHIKELRRGISSPFFIPL